MISPVGCSTYTYPSSPCSKVYDNNLASYVLLWFTSQNYTWVDVDLGANYDIESLRLTSRAHGGGYIFPGKLTVGLYKGPSASGGRCAEFITGTSNQVVYDLNINSLTSKTFPLLNLPPEPPEPLSACLTRYFGLRSTGATASDERGLRVVPERGRPGSDAW